MGRPKRVTVGTWAVGPSPAASAEHQAHIRRVLDAANFGPPNERLVPRALALHQALTFVADGVDAHLAGDAFTLGQRLSFDHLKTRVLSGEYVLRQCRECHRWFLSKSPRPVVCRTDACQKAVKRRKAVVNRKDAKDRGLAALAGARAGIAQTRPKRTT